jgi:hypothetical protein
MNMNNVQLKCGKIGSDSVKVRHTGFQARKRKTTRSFFAPFALGDFVFPLIRAKKIKPNSANFRVLPHFSGYFRFMGLPSNIFILCKIKPAQTTAKLTRIFTSVPVCVDLWPG